MGVQKSPHPARPTQFLTNTTGIYDDLTYYTYRNVMDFSYSLVFIKNVSRFMELLNGTQFSIDQQKIMLFIDYLLDGQRYFHRNNGMVNFAIGRSAVYSGNGYTIYLCLERLLNMGIEYRYEEIKNYYNSYHNKYFLISKGIKYFYNSGTLVSQCSSGYIAARGGAENNKLTRIANGEGMLNYNLSYGSNTSYMYYGDEYSSIGAVFDFSLFPGTTTYYMSDEELLKKYKNDYNDTYGFDVEGLKCDGIVNNDINAGILVTKLINNGIGGLNAFIIFNDRMYVLGANFNSQRDNHYQIITTVDQCLSEINNCNGSIGFSESIDNRGFLYRNLCEYPLLYKFAERSGNYRRGDENGDEEIVKRNVFICYYDWGNSIKNVSYAYEVIPIMDNLIDEEIEIEHIYNDDNCQGIEFSNGILIAYAYKDSIVTLKNGNIITLKKCEPCIINSNE